MSRIALITGTSTGIGLSTAIALARAGFSVVATMRDPAKADALLSRARTEGVTVDVRALDVQDDGSVERCVGDVLREHGRIDVLVNNAGAGHFGTTEMVSMDELPPHDGGELLRGLPGDPGRAALDAGRAVGPDGRA